MVVTGIVLGFSLQLVGAWVSVPGSPQSNNIGAPINTGVQTQTKPGTLGVGILSTQYFNLNDGSKPIEPGSVLVSDATGNASWQKLDCKAAPVCTGGNNCIKPDGSCGKLYVHVFGGSNIGNSCWAIERSVGTPDSFDRGCPIMSGNTNTGVNIDVHGKVSCEGNSKSVPQNQGGTACVNEDGTYGWVKVRFAGSISDGSCGVGWTDSPYDLKPGVTYDRSMNPYLHSDCGSRDFNLSMNWSCQ